jgi:carbon monoxide dehydrogenase subunit G
MNISGKLRISANREAVFDRLQDARQFISLVEGVQDLKEIDPTHYEAVFETKVAYMRFKFKVAVEVLSMERPSKIAAKVEGSPLGVVGRLSATTLTTLTEVGNETQIDYSVDAIITGKLGSMGQPVLRSKAKELAAQFARNMSALFHEEIKGAVP